MFIIIAPIQAVEPRPLFEAMRHLSEEIFDILWDNKQFLHALRKSARIFGEEQQAVFHVWDAGETIPAFIFLESAPFDTADLREFQEQAIVKMTRRKVDANSAGSDDISGWRSKEPRIPIGKGKTDNDQENLPGSQSNLLIDKKRKARGNDDQYRYVLRGKPKRNGRTVDIKLSAIWRIFVTHVRYPCIMPPLKQSHAEQHDEKKNERQVWRPGIQRDKGDPRVWELFEIQAGNAKNKAVKE